MAKIVNLRQARKRKAREEKNRVAETNRQRFGRNKGVQRRENKEREQAENLLNGAKLQKEGDDISSSSEGDS